MYKILHIPTASYVYDYSHYISRYMVKNALQYNDIVLDKAKATSSDACPAYFRTKAIARKFIKSFQWYDYNQEYIILLGRQDVNGELGALLDQKHLEIVEHI